MQDEILAAVALDIVIDLLVEYGTESRDAERLGLPAGEHGGPVRIGQNADLAVNVAYVLGAASVDAHATAVDGSAPAATQAELDFAAIYGGEVYDPIADPTLPVVCNINIGHALPRCILPFGVEAAVDVNGQKITFG